MSRYTGPKLKIVRRLGTLPGFTEKISNRQKTPGQHGIKINPDTDSNAFSSYGRRLIEKQKLRFNYGISESKLLSYITQTKKKRGSTGILLLQMLELRLDNIVYKLGFGNTIQKSRQLVNHGHILVNNQKVDIPSFQCTIGDKICLNPKKQIKDFELTSKNCPKYLELISNEKNNQYLGILKQLPDRSDIELDINELFVVEYYSR